MPGVLNPQGRSTLKPDLPLSIPVNELISAQPGDFSLADLVSGAKSAEEIRSTAHGCFIQDGMLVRKWTACTDKGLGEPLYQVVIPAEFREVVLNTAHGDISGHFGVKKTPRSFIIIIFFWRHFFWPRLKKDIVKFIKTYYTCQIK